jgi:hypothetical protein
VEGNGPDLISCTVLPFFWRNWGNPRIINPRFEIRTSRSITCSIPKRKKMSEVIGYNAMSPCSNVVYRLQVAEEVRGGILNTRLLTEFSRRENNVMWSNWTQFLSLSNKYMKSLVLWDVSSSGKMLQTFRRNELRSSCIYLQRDSCWLLVSLPLWIWRWR